MTGSARGPSPSLDVAQRPRAPAFPVSRLTRKAKSSTGREVETDRLGWHPHCSPSGPDPTPVPVGALPCGAWGLRGFGHRQPALPPSQGQGSLVLSEYTRGPRAGRPSGHGQLQGRQQAGGALSLSLCISESAHQISTSESLHLSPCSLPVCISESISRDSTSLSLSFLSLIFLRLFLLSLFSSLFI